MVIVNVIDGKGTGWRGKFRHFEATIPVLGEDTKALLKRDFERTVKYEVGGAKRLSHLDVEILCDFIVEVE